MTSNDLDKIRHDLENYVFNQESRLALDFDTEVTVVEMSRCATLEFAEQVGGGTSFHYKDLMKVVAHPDDGSALIVGICDPQQVIRQFYEGLLNVARQGFRYDKDGNDNDWVCSPMTFYNRIKSPIIEDYLMGREYGDDELQIRQSEIRHAFTIAPASVARCSMARKDGIMAVSPFKMIRNLSCILTTLLCHVFPNGNRSLNKRRAGLMAQWGLWTAWIGIDEEWNLLDVCPSNCLTILTCGMAIHLRTAGTAASVRYSCTR